MVQAGSVGLASPTSHSLTRAGVEFLHIPSLKRRCKLKNRHKHRWLQRIFAGKKRLLNASYIGLNGFVRLSCVNRCSVFESGFSVDSLFATRHTMLKTHFAHYQMACFFFTRVVLRGGLRALGVVYRLMETIERSTCLINSPNSLAVTVFDFLGSMDGSVEFVGYMWHILLHG